MGQAKSRGDYETRQAAAIARNDALAAQIDSLPKDNQLHQVRRRVPIQRIAVALMAMGALNPMSKE